MLTRTHLAIVIFFILFFINSVQHKFIFVAVALIATLLPDVDSQFSKLGRKKIFRIVQFFVKHRGIFHSYTFAILITLIFVFFIPQIALGFFLGYGLHLLGDSFTLEGIVPFYPYKRKVRGKMRTGGRTEIIVFFAFVIVDAFLLIMKTFSVF